MSAAGGAGSSGSISAGQSTLFVTMGADQGGGDTSSTSITGRIFGLEITQIDSGPGYGGLILNAAGSASGQSFFRQMTIGTSVSLLTSAATYNSATNTWSWALGAINSSTTHTFQFFR